MSDSDDFYDDPFYDAIALIESQPTERPSPKRKLKEVLPEPLRSAEAHAEPNALLESLGQNKKQKPNPDHLRKRGFKGNTNYVQLYNKAVKEFFDYSSPSFLFDGNAKPLARSRISVAGDLDYMELLKRDRMSPEEGSEDEDEEGDSDGGGAAGTVWTGSEKETFFNCLGKYSIHRLDQIKLQLPKKTDLEILNYYYLLKNEMNSLKHRSKTFRKLVKIDEMPIAYEMSNHFIDMEESQAYLMDIIERQKNNDDMQRTKSGLLAYIYKDPTAEGATLANVYTQPIGPADLDIDSDATIVSDEEPHKPTNENLDSLINVGMAVQLSQLYSRNTITPISKATPKMNLPVVHSLETLSIHMTKALIHAICVNKITTHWFNRHKKLVHHEKDQDSEESDSEESGRISMYVSRTDVLLALKQMKKRGSWHGNVSKSEYFRLLPLRLGLVLVDYKGSEVPMVNLNKYIGKVKRDSYLNEDSLGEAIAMSQFEKAEGMVVEEKEEDEFFDAREDSFDSSEDDDLSNLQSQSTTLIGSLPTSFSQIIKRPYDYDSDALDEVESFIVDDTDKVIDNKIAEKLFAQETMTLDESDTTSSVRYEHLILTYLSSMNQPRLHSRELAEKYVDSYNFNVIKQAEIIKNQPKKRGRKSKREIEEIQRLAEAAANSSGAASEALADSQDFSEITSDMLLLHQYDFASY
ncbi:hypothetical protein BABINDRAFT_7675 [Babjeviella inositovora NRRL Y-12698]|uniref:Myb-like domain-containing protein n=1 Tax=Babjeviella inositovora NRRL Y-12698 TaxID=984486 RepID=A0A1E3QR82_9ASCO|nr:uncharacterized protein BABINDRAFT_7675 [Babjeviella inositovora NRRL Y-12698]ODQ80205.1 hypothetical protein BABINDRAFT_7675 [Babjeviella inositovora NRRL Y-12698]